MNKKAKIPKEISAFSSKGGRKSSANMTPKERSERAKLAAKARWAKKEAAGGK